VWLLDLLGAAARQVTDPARRSRAAAADRASWDSGYRHGFAAGQADGDALAYSNGYADGWDAAASAGS
jgi:hypothetical protein